MIRLTPPQSLVLAALLAPTVLTSAAAAHLREISQPAKGASTGALPDLDPPYTEAVDGNRSKVTLHSALGQRMPLLSSVAYAIGWHAVIARTGRQAADAEALNVSETDPGQAGAIRAEQAWARATAPQQKVGGAYVTLISPADDRLVGVSSPIAGRAEVHEMRMDGNVMRMREVTDGLALPAGKVVALAPGGYHIMLMDLKQPLVAGQVILMQLRFRSAPPMELRLQVAPVGASAPPRASASAPSGAGASAPSGAEGHGGMPGQVH
jgi:copper(I)-binding protein